MDEYSDEYKEAIKNHSKRNVGNNIHTINRILEIAKTKRISSLVDKILLDKDNKIFIVFNYHDSKNYFEFHGDDFRSGDFNEKGDPQYAEYSPFTVKGDSIVLDSIFFKKAEWQWSISKRRLELIGTKQNGEKARFIFSRKKYSLWHSMSSLQRWVTLILIAVLIYSFLFLNS